GGTSAGWHGGQGPTRCIGARKRRRLHLGGRIAARPTEHGLLATAEWIVGQAIRGKSPSDLVRGLCQRLNDRAIPVGRLQVAFRILHPLFGAVAITWDEDDDVHVELREDNQALDSEFALSPFFAMLQSGANRLRYRLDDGEAL